MTPKTRLTSLTLGALGIVFGDRGTSPLYTLHECTSGDHGAAPAPENIQGVLSLIFWSLTMVVSVKYLGFIMKADNRGEGGILALLALVPETLRGNVRSSSPTTWGERRFSPRNAERWALFARASSRFSPPTPHPPRSSSASCPSKSSSSAPRSISSYS
jgi:hypothetical protein